MRGDYSGNVARSDKTHPPLITSARIGRSLDTSQRTRRYVITMVVRVLCFVCGMFAPLPWNLVLLVTAAFLPAAAVLLANAVDHRTPPPPVDTETPDRLALTSGEVVPGEVDEEGTP